MLINLSNHPSEKWVSEQRGTAIEQYGKIIDMPFPRIPPEASYDEVWKIADDYFEQIKTRAKQEKTTVHLMGEMTFTYMLVDRLKDANIPCVASTTERTVEERDGKKIVQFNFIQFRAYF